MAQKNKEPNCTDCPERKPEVLIENYPVVSLIERYGSLFGNGMGGISAEGIRLALDSELWITDINRSSYIRKLLTYLTTAIQTQQKDN